MSTGFFGKVPSHGDFVGRGLDADFKEVWDAWLQRGVAGSKATLGDDWLNVYLVGPIWRFALTPGVCGPGGWVGLMLPSVDKVGRYFPLTLAAPIPEDAIALQMLVAAATWHDAAEEIALGALQDKTTDADQIEQAILSRCSQVLEQPPISCAVTTSDPRQALQAQALCLPFSFGSTPGHGILAFSHRMLETLFGAQHSIWWTRGSEHVHPGMFACPQLPAPEAFASMLTDAVANPSWYRLDGYSLDLPAQPDSVAADQPPAQDGSAEAAPEVDPETTQATQFDDLIQDAQLADPVAEPVAEPTAASEDGTRSDDSTIETIPDSDERTQIPLALPDEVSLPLEVNPVAVSVDEILAGFGGEDDGEDTERQIKGDEPSSGDRSD